MAGAGYKLFNTGDVLTAAQVNTYLMEQTVMVFANAAARTTALSGVVSEGMISYLKDTNAVEVYDGSNWVSSDDPNAIQNTIVDAKGDLISASAADTPARLAVGNNGETLVADSSATTGLRWQNSFAAGKNLVINGAMDFWQRGTSFTNVTSYTADRWAGLRAGFATGLNLSRQTVTPTDVNGAAQYSLRVQRASGNTGTGGIFCVQPIESTLATPYAGQILTLSFWAKRGANFSASGNTMTATVYAGSAEFNPGGGGGTITAFISQGVTLTTSWQRFTVSGTMTAGRIALNVDFSYAPTGTAGADDWFEITGVQLEQASVATAFSRAGGTLAGELAACQRYYIKSFVQGTAPTTNVGTRDGAVESLSVRAAGALGILYIRFPVVMRGTPTVTVYNPLAANNQIRNLDRSSDCTGTTVEAAVDNSFRVYGTLPSGTVSTDGLSIHYQAVAEL